MAKKKAQHLYEILGKGGSQPPPTSDRGASSPEVAARKEVQAKFAESIMQQEVASDKALENVVIIRKDTAIAGILLAIVMWIIAFLVGRWTVQKSVPPVSPTLKRSAATVASQPEPSPISVSAQETSQVTETAASATERYYLAIAAYEDSQKRYADEAAEFLRSKGYSSAVVEKSGSMWVLRLRNFQSNSDPQALKILGEIRSLEYKGRKDFRTAHFVEVR